MIGWRFKIKTRRVEISEDFEVDTGGGHLQITCRKKYSSCLICKESCALHSMGVGCSSANAHKVCTGRGSSSLTPVTLIATVSRTGRRRTSVVAAGLVSVSHQQYSSCLIL